MTKFIYIDERKIKVKLGTKHVGDIKPASTGGWYYQPKNSKFVGDVFNTITEVKRSIEQ